jgi:hypothetical protein
MEIKLGIEIKESIDVDKLAEMAQIFGDEEANGKSGCMSSCEWPMGSRE